MTVLVATTIIEITRLYLGYLGNLTEKVPELAGFWLLTVLLQLPMQGNVIQDWYCKSTMHTSILGPFDKILSKIVRVRKCSGKYDRCMTLKMKIHRP